MPHGSHYPIAFMHPSVGQIHNLSTETADRDRVGWLSIPMFVDEVTRGAEAWYGKYCETARVKRNMVKSPGLGQRACGVTSAAGL